VESSVVWPLVSNVIRARSMNHTFGMVRKYATGAPKPHQGWNFEPRVGEPVYSIADGEVVFVRDKGDYGLQLCLSFSFGDNTYAEVKVNANAHEERTR
jgi:murein DD-endopeptidase MepM/ murein hydrolase activator NlpD